MNKNLVQTLLFSLCLLVPRFGLANSSKEDIIKVYASSVVKRNHGNPQQIGIIEIADRSIKTIEVELQFPWGTLNLYFSDLEEKHHIVSFEFPVLKERTTVRVSIALGETALFEKSIQFSPPKTWKTYDVQISHHDLGYADYYSVPNQIAHFVKQTLRVFYSFKEQTSVPRNSDPRQGKRAMSMKRPKWMRSPDLILVS